MKNIFRSVCGTLRLNSDQAAGVTIDINGTSRLNWVRRGRQAGRTKADTGALAEGVAVHPAPRCVKGLPTGEARTGSSRHFAGAGD